MWDLDPPWHPGDNTSDLFFVNGHIKQATSVGCIPAAALSQGSGSRWLQVIAGEGYPQAERTVPVA